MRLLCIVTSLLTCTLPGPGSDRKNVAGQVVDLAEAAVASTHKKDYETWVSSKYCPNGNLGPLLVLLPTKN